MKVLHQFTDGVAVGDAITDQAFTLRTWIRQAGIESDLYALHLPDTLASEVKPVSSYQHNTQEHYVVYHHSIGSSLVDQLLKIDARLIVIYHNITPPAFYSIADPALAQQLQVGRDQLVQLLPKTELALGDSPFNEQELIAAGFPRTGVLPITLDESKYDHTSSQEVLARFADGSPLLLFAGRITPHKRQEDLIKLLYHYRRIEPNAKLVLLGAFWTQAYVRWLHDLIEVLDLQEHVIMTGHVTQQEMLTYFRRANLYVSMSEHEGFGKPLIESMYFDLPVLAYASTSVPGTLHGAGVLFHEKNYEVLAEMVDILITNHSLRTTIIAKQRQRLQAFLAANVQLQWDAFCRSL